MTFLEAAIEILQGSEDPLHITEITRLAVERKLLSHVGRDPEAAMRSCLNTAVRSKVHDGLVMRSKPGHYRLRPGVAVPELPEPPSEPEPLPEPEPAPTKKKASKKKASKSKKKASKSSGDASAKAKPKKSARKPRKAKPKAEEEVEPEEVEAEPEDDDDDDLDDDVDAEDGGDDNDGGDDVEDDDDGDDDDSEDAASAGDTPSAAGLPPPDLDPSRVRFRGPEGSGLEGETDVALVMANAMSRLVDERPELREELEAMQKPQTPEVEVIEVGRKRRRDEERDDRNDERGGRRRRRRRRRNRRVEWSGASSRREEAQGVELLDKVAAVLAEAGSRSLHVRQIAENLAGQGVLGGEISEIERAVTAAILLDVHERKGASRFAVRGDARYQLRGNRLPEKAAAAEQALRTSARQLESETETQLLMWLQSLGARSLEALVRVWLTREKFDLVATLPPSRGLSKLVADDPDPDEDDGGRTLVLIFPRKTSLEPKLWDGEAERNNCVATLVFTMGDSSDPIPAETRVISARDLVRWMLEQGIGVRTLTIEVPVLDANLIESVGGLDT